MQFGDKLKLLRKQQNMTQVELASHLSITDRAIGYYESNVRFPKDAHILTKLSSLFEISLDELLNDSLPQRFSYSQLLETARLHFQLATPEQQKMIHDELTSIYKECCK